MVIKDVTRLDCDALRDQPLEWVRGYDSALLFAVGEVHDTLLDLDTLDGKTALMMLETKLHAQEQVAHYYAKAREK